MKKILLILLLFFNSLITQNNKFLNTKRYIFRKPIAVHNEFFDEIKQKVNNFNNKNFEENIWKNFFLIIREDKKSFINILNNIVKIIMLIFFIIIIVIKKFNITKPKNKILNKNNSISKKDNSINDKEENENKEDILKNMNDKKQEDNNRQILNKNIENIEEQEHLQQAIKNSINNQEKSEENKSILISRMKEIHNYINHEDLNIIKELYKEQEKNFTPNNNITTIDGLKYFFYYDENDEKIKYISFVEKNVTGDGHCGFYASDINPHNLLKEIQSNFDNIIYHDTMLRSLLILQESEKKELSIKFNNFIIDYFLILDILSQVNIDPKLSKLKFEFGKNETEKNKQENNLDILSQLNIDPKLSKLKFKFDENETEENKQENNLILINILNIFNNYNPNKNDIEKYKNNDMYKNLNNDNKKKFLSCFKKQNHTKKIDLLLEIINQLTILSIEYENKQYDIKSLLLKMLNNFNSIVTKNLILINILYIFSNYNPYEKDINQYKELYIYKSLNDNNKENFLSCFKEQNHTKKIDLLLQIVNQLTILSIEYDHKQYDIKSLLLNMLNNFKNPEIFNNYWTMRLGTFSNYDNNSKNKNTIKKNFPSLEILRPIIALQKKTLIVFKDLDENFIFPVQNEEDSMKTLINKHQDTVIIIHYGQSDNNPSQTSNGHYKKLEWLNQGICNIPPKELNQLKEILKTKGCIIKK